MAEVMNNFQNLRPNRDLMALHESASLRSIEAWREAVLEMHGDFTMISYFAGKNTDSDANCLLF